MTYWNLLCMMMKAVTQELAKSCAYFKLPLQVMEQGSFLVGSSSCLLLHSSVNT
jgi:hypothetical protein